MSVENSRERLDKRVQRCKLLLTTRAEKIMRGAKDKARQAKQKLKRGIKKVALKVADKMSEENPRLC